MTENKVYKILRPFYFNKQGGKFISLTWHIDNIWQASEWIKVGYQDKDSEWEMIANDLKLDESYVKQELESMFDKFMDSDNFIINGDESIVVNQRIYEYKQAKTCEPFWLDVTNVNEFVKAPIETAIMLNLALLENLAKNIARYF
jgi:hypothetical protein